MENNDFSATGYETSSLPRVSSYFNLLQTIPQSPRGPSPQNPHSQQPHPLDSARASQNGASFLKISVPPTPTTPSGHQSNSPDASSSLGQLNILKREGSFREEGSLNLAQNQGNLYSLGSQFNLFSPAMGQASDYVSAQGPMSPASVIPLTPTGYSSQQWPTNFSNLVFSPSQHPNKNLAVKRRPLNQMPSKQQLQGFPELTSFDDSKLKPDLDSFRGVTRRDSYMRLTRIKQATNICDRNGCLNPVYISNSRINSNLCAKHASTNKLCHFLNCSNSVRGRTKFCIAHGGGKRCQQVGCTKSAIGSTKLCKRHGGGKRCKTKDCTKSAQGATEFCVAHGGGKRCSYPDCSKLARGRSKFCIPHGGGTRCQHMDCTKLAQGSTKLCIAHGGGKRCQNPTCNKSAIGSTKFCVSHGGGKRCQYVGCIKSAIASTKLCVAHGGGKRCQKESCSKSAIGSTKFCIAHGGKRGS